MPRFLLLALSAQLACAEEKASVLHGSWRSDAEATNDYLSKHAKMEDFQRKKLALFFGRATVTFKPDGSGSIRMAARTIPTKEGGEIELTEGMTEFTYRILGETESQIVIESFTGEALTDAHPFAVLKLHDRDTYSVSLSDGIAEINGREFFKRVEEPEGGKEKSGKAGDGGKEE